MPHVYAINCIEVPRGHEEMAASIREQYVAYFRRQAGFVSSTFLRAEGSPAGINFINIVVWASRDAYDAVVNVGFDNVDGMNSDGMKVLGKGFPEPIVVHPAVYEVIAGDALA